MNLKIITSDCDDLDPQSLKPREAGTRKLAPFLRNDIIDWGWSGPRLQGPGCRECVPAVVRLARGPGEPE